MAKRNKRKLKKTLLIVGEGEAEKAFLYHLRSIYGIGDPKVTIKSAGGKGPSNVVNEAISTKEASGFDAAFVLMDTDVEWPKSVIKRANSKKIILIAQEPCLEGFLLQILQTPIPNPATNRACKKAVHPILSGKETCKESYQKLFTEAVLNEARQSVAELDLLIDIIQGKK